jgi:hypothetical protein
MPLIADGQLSFDGGQDVSLPSTRLEPNKFVAGINVNTSKGVLRPRYAYCRKALTIQPGGYSYEFNKIADFNFNFKTGLFQAFVPYRVGNTYYQLIVINGLIYMLNQKDFSVSVLTLNAATLLNPVAKRIYWGVCSKYVIFADFPNRPVIIENGVARRSDASLNELPVLNLVTYNQNRAVFSNSLNEFTAGDPAGSLSAPLAPITINEILAGGPYAGEIYKAPSDYDDPITALTTLQSVDTSTGIGSAIVATENQIFTYDTTQPRSDWVNLNQFGTCLSYNAGIVDQMAQVNVNSDLFFIAKDGTLRGLSSARDDQKKWSRTPISLPVENWTYHHTATPDNSLISFARLAYFNNKLFWTVRPTYTKALRMDKTPILDICHGGLVSLDMANVSRGFGEVPPAWDGLWTGVRPMHMLVNDDRMFIVSKDSGINEIYEVLPKETVDRTDEGQRRRIKSVVYTRDYFVKDVFSDKNLVRMESNISDILGEFSYRVKYQPSDAPNFIPWAEYNLDVKNGYTHFEDGDVLQRQPVALKELVLNRPLLADAENPVNKDLYGTVKRLKFRIEIEGDSWQLDEFAVMATLNKEEEAKGETLEQPCPVEAFHELTGDWEYKEFGQ